MHKSDIFSSDLLRRRYLQSSKVDNAVNVGMRHKDLVQCLFICDVDLVEVWSLAAEQLDAVEGDFRGIVEAVDNYNFVAMFEEGKSGERADITGSSGPVDVSMSSRTFWRIEGGANQGSGIPSGWRGIASSYPGIIHSPSDKDSSNSHLVLRRVIDLERNFKGLVLGVIYETRNTRKGGERAWIYPRTPLKKNSCFPASSRLVRMGCHCIKSRRDNHQMSGYN
jgi:hypothetical protein